MTATIPQQLQERARAMGEAIAVHYRADGAWRTLTWAAYAEAARRFAGALIGRGLEAGESVAIVGNNRMQWLVAFHGALAAGGVPVGAYQTLTPEQLAYVVNHCEAPIVVVEDAGQWAKIAESISAGDLGEQVRGVAMDSAGIDDDRVATFEAFLAEGDAHLDAVEPRLSAIERDDLGTLIYTSGTTGVPKGVMLSHGNLADTASAAKQGLGYDLGPADVMVSYLPLSHIAEQLFSIHLPVTFGYTIWICERTELLKEVLAEAHPTVFLGVPRVWEKFKAALEARLAEATGVKSLIVGWARSVGVRSGRHAIDHGEPGGLLGLQSRLARRLFAEPLRAKLGLDRLQIALTAAAPIGEDVLEFFLSCGIVLHDVYGQSEVTGPSTFNRPVPGQRKFGTVGKALPGLELRIADDGEILVRGPGVFQGYYKNPEATAETLIDGWLHSGDLGQLDKDGFLRITGRKKDLIITAGGKNVGPGSIEAGLKAIEGIAHAVVVGDRRKFLSAVMTLEPESAAQLARGNGWPTEVPALAEHAGFTAWLQGEVDQVNSGLARYEQIKKFVVLPVEFTLEGGELTPTQKVKRRIVDEKYKGVIDGFYA